MKRRDCVILGGSAAVLWPALVHAQFFPKTLIDRAIEARSAGDIAKDNEIVVKVNKIMADVGSVSASTEIYEQRLLITGLFDDKPTYDKFEKSVRAVKDVKTLYWHASYMSKADQEAEKKKGTMIGWAAGLEMTTKAQGRIVGTKNVADVNYRIAGDAFGNLYLLGLARSADEKKLALARVKDGEGVKKVVDYVVVRPK